jgi:hypothetical protein
MPGVVRILGIVTVAFLAVVAMDTLGVFRHIFLMSEPGIRDSIEDEYPDGDAMVDFLENCTICDENGCRTYPGPCWRATVVVEGENGTSVVEMLMDAMGNVLEKSESPCTEWWCEAVPCRYTYTKVSGGISTEYTNHDCSEPEIACDSAYGRCRACLAGEDCISRVVTASPSETTYMYEVITTGERAVIDTEELVCRIYSRGNVVFSEGMDVGECGSLMYDNTRCYDGICDFVPEFALIPL